MRTLVAGWFSYQGFGATAGDLMTRDVVARWLTEAGLPFDVVNAGPFVGGTTWDRVQPDDYSDLVFVCGPFGNGPPITELLETFSHCRVHGVNLSMLQPLSEWNPFDLLLERDSDRASRPDVSLAADTPLVPVVGVILVHPQEEYGTRGLHQDANEAIRSFLDTQHVARVSIDTQLDRPDSVLRTPSEVVSLIARMDLVVTTRLHGTVLAIKCGVPPIAIDPIRGGAKVTRQADTLGWPACIQAEELSPERLMGAFEYCLSDEAIEQTRVCVARARHILERTRADLLAAVSG